MEWISDSQVWIALVTLTALEIVLGIDNIIFISLLAVKLPVYQQSKARTIGLALAMLTRILLLFSLSWLMKLTIPLFIIFTNEISIRDIVLMIGGLFLIGKSTLEIHDKFEGERGNFSVKAKVSFISIIIQIMFLDIIFSLDSVVTAVGMANQFSIMVAAIIIAMIFMMASSGKTSAFIEKHPTVKMLALSFLILIGIALIGDGLDMHIPKGYIYFAMAFSVFVEMLNIKLRKKIASSA